MGVLERGITESKIDKLLFGLALIIGLSLLLSKRSILLLLVDILILSNSLEDIQICQLEFPCRCHDALGSLWAQHCQSPSVGRIKFDISFFNFTNLITANTTSLV